MFIAYTIDGFAGGTLLKMLFNLYLYVYIHIHLCMYIYMFMHVYMCVHMYSGSQNFLFSKYHLQIDN